MKRLVCLFSVMMFVFVSLGCALSEKYFQPAYISEITLADGLPTIPLAGDYYIFDINDVAQDFRTGLTEAYTARDKTLPDYNIYHFSKEVFPPTLNRENMLEEVTKSFAKKYAYDHKTYATKYGDEGTHYGYFTAFVDMDSPLGIYHYLAQCYILETDTEIIAVLCMWMCDLVQPLKDVNIVIPLLRCMRRADVKEIDKYTGAFLAYDIPKHNDLPSTMRVYCADEIPIVKESLEKFSNSFDKDRKLPYDAVESESLTNLESLATFYQTLFETTEQQLQRINGLEILYTEVKNPSNPTIRDVIISMDIGDRFLEIVFEQGMGEFILTAPAYMHGIRPAN